MAFFVPVDFRGLNIIVKKKFMNLRVKYRLVAFHPFSIPIFAL